MIYLYLIFSFVGGFIVGKFWNRKNSVESINSERVEKKKEYLDKIMNLFGTNSEITNDDVEKLLSVSDATATNYLNELEKQGLITQVGTEGRGVTYRKNG